MKRRLLLSNLVLVLLLAASIWLLEARDARDDSRQPMQASAVPVALDNNPAAPISSAKIAPQAYLSDAVGRFLFSPDRNPNVAEPVKAAPAPPPFPAVYGLLLFSGTPRIILGFSAGDQRSYQKGDRAGAFEILAFDDKNVTFVWHGRRFERAIQELAAASPPLPGSMPARDVAAQPATPPLQDKIMGPDLGANEHACLADDSSPAGTVSSEGFKKVVTQTPFGSICRWSK